MALHAALLTEQSVSMAIGSTADGVDEAEEEDEEAASRVIADVEVADAIDVHAIDSSVRAYLVARRKFELMPDHEMSNTFYRVGTNFGSAIRGVLEQYRDASEVIDAEEQARRIAELETRVMADLYPRVKACTRCRAVSYCCRDCQAADWPRHKVVCKAPKE